VAAAVRVKENGTMAGTIALVGVGDFGERVARLVTESSADCAVVPERQLGEVFSAQPDLVIMALWRPCIALCERVDELAFTHRVPWLPISLEEQFVIRVGPAVVPPAGPCYRCYRARRIQHDGQYRATAILHRAYQADACCGPRGFLPHHVRMAGGLALFAIAEMTEAEVGPQPALRGRVLTVQSLRTEITSSAVIPCESCDRCAQGPAKRTDSADLFDLAGLAAGSMAG
jgi:bacteriocin biosynthesis cyclodehydratase domain-containing protein